MAVKEARDGSLVVKLQFSRRSSQGPVRRVSRISERRSSLPRRPDCAPVDVISIDALQHEVTATTATDKVHVSP
jgi:hypothetical protein